MTPDSRHAQAVAPNLSKRHFKTAIPDAVWLADIGYNPADEGWLHLAAVKDLATRETVDWSMSDRIKSTLCEDALKMAIQNRRPSRVLINLDSEEICLLRRGWSDSLGPWRVCC